MEVKKPAKEDSSQSFINGVYDGFQGERCSSEGSGTPTDYRAGWLKGVAQRRMANALPKEERIEMIANMVRPEDMLPPFEKETKMPLERKKFITGQVFTRLYTDENSLAPDNSDRRLFGVFGIIAIPRNIPIIGECQYVVTGNQQNRLVSLNLHLDGEKDFGGTFIGAGGESIMTAPIWRC